MFPQVRLKESSGLSFTTDEAPFFDGPQDDWDKISSQIKTEAGDLQIDLTTEDTAAGTAVFSLEVIRNPVFNTRAAEYVRDSLLPEALLRSCVLIELVPELQTQHVAAGDNAKPPCNNVSEGYNRSFKHSIHTFRRKIPMYEYVPRRLATIYSECGLYLERARCVLP